MLEELQRRNYSQKTTTAYLRAVTQFAKHFDRSPDQLGPEHIRRFQSHLFSVKKLAAHTVAQQTAALRFLFVKTLKRPFMTEHIPFPKIPFRLPIEEWRFIPLPIGYGAGCHFPETRRLHYPRISSAGRRIGIIGILR